MSTDEDDSPESQVIADLREMIAEELRFPPSDEAMRIIRKVLDILNA